MPTEAPTSPAASRSSKRAAARAEREAAHARKRRRQRLLKALGAIGAVVVVIAVVAGIALVRSSQSSTGSTAASGAAGSSASSAAASAVLAKVATVPSSTYDAVGAGTVGMRPKALSGAPALTAGGKPQVVYVGAEYCPYCAAQRWAVAEALSRFGTLHGVGETTSSASDIYPSTPTLSFHGASYTSPYLAFSGSEIQSNVRQGAGYAPLDRLTASEQKLLDTYDTQTYTGVASGSIPFLDLGGRYVSAGASYSPQLLAGMTQSQVAAQLANPSSPVAKAVDGTANVITAQLCRLTGGKPGAVCTSAGVKAAQ